MADIEKTQEIHREETNTSEKAPEELKKHLTVDTIHQDEAMKVLANYDGPEEWDEAEEKRVTRKIDKRLLPILMATYGLQCKYSGNNHELLYTMSEDNFINRLLTTDDYTADYDKAMISQAVCLEVTPTCLTLPLT